MRFRNATLAKVPALRAQDEINSCYDELSIWFRMFLGSMRRAQVPIALKRTWEG